MHRAQANANARLDAYALLERITVAAETGYFDSIYRLNYICRFFMKKILPRDAGLRF